jgi:hypothetical protein
MPILIELCYTWKHFYIISLSPIRFALSKLFFNFWHWMSKIVTIISLWIYDFSKYKTDVIRLKVRITNDSYLYQFESTATLIDNYSILLLR